MCCPLVNAYCTGFEVEAGIVWPNQEDDDEGKEDEDKAEVLDPSQKAAPPLVDLADAEEVLLSDDDETEILSDMSSYCSGCEEEGCRICIQRDI